MKKIVLLFWLMVLFLWEFSSLYFENSKFFVSSPCEILFCLFNTKERLFYHAWVTFKEMGGGIALAFFFSFPLALGMKRFSFLKAILEPFLVFTQCFPLFVLAPLMVFWFGWSFQAIVIPTALMIFFPLTMNIYEGLSRTPYEMEEFFTWHGATPFKKFFHLRLPYAIPSIINGCKVSLALSGIGAIAGEWAGGQEGLGTFMLQAKRGADLDAVFAAIFVLMTLTFTLYQVFSLGEKKMTRYLNVLFICFFVSSCSMEKEPKTVTLTLDWLPNPNHVPLYVGIEKGFFEEEGIFLEIKMLSDPSDTIPFVRAEVTDLALYYLSDYLRAKEKGINIQMLSVLIAEPLNSFIFRKNSGIHTKEDLNGKVIGFSQDGYNEKFLRYILKENAITPSDLKNVSFDLVGTLGTNQVDAIVDAYWNIESEHLRSYGIETGYFLLKEFKVPTYHEIIVITKEKGKLDNKKFILAFQRALSKSIAYSKENGEEAFKIYVAKNKDKTEKTLSWEKNAWNLTLPLLTEETMPNGEVVEIYKEWIKNACN